MISIIVAFLRIKALRETYSPHNKDLSGIVLELAGYRPVLHKAVKFYVYTAIFSQLTVGVINTFGAIYAVNSLGMNAFNWGVATTLGSASSILASLILSAKMSLPDKKTMLASSSLIALAQLFYAIPYFNRATIPLVYLATIISSIGGAIVGSSISSILTHVLPTELRGRATGIQRTLETLGSALASYVAGLMYAYLGPFTSFIVSFIIGLASTIYLAYIT